MPKATLMVIEDAERFGLASCTSCAGASGAAAGRGVRAGRPAARGPRGAPRRAGRDRGWLRARRAGPALRGPGEVLGTRQHGRLPDLRFADLVRDARLVSFAREAARETVRRDPGLARTPDLARAVKLRWGERLALVGVG